MNATALTLSVAGIACAFPSAVLAQLSSPTCYHEAVAIGRFGTNGDSGSNTYDEVTVCDSNAAATSNWYSGMAGGDATSTFYTTGGTGASMGVSHDTGAQAAYDSPLNGSAEASGTSSVSATLTFRRTAWLWFDGSYDYDPGDVEGVGEFTRVKLVVPGGPGYTYSTSNGDPDALSWSDEGVITSTGTITLSTSSDISVSANSSNTHDEGDSTAEADVVVVECIADWNQDRSVNTQDVTAFLNSWNASESDADLNGDGSINTQDVTLFMNAHANGNCVKP